MLDEIRSFFESLRKPFNWPESFPTTDPVVRELRAESEHHWRLSMHYLDETEAKIVEVYDAGGDVPATIDLIDEVVAVIRRKEKSPEQRFEEIARLLLARRAAFNPRPSRQ